MSTDATRGRVASGNSPVPDSASPVRTPRRADVEGLRLIAVVLVAVYHYTQAGVSGGVDVFLFLSGYLVLGSLARRLGRGDPARLGSFYWRTARRLLPMAWLAAGTTLFAGLRVLGPGDTAGFVEQFVASFLYVENWWLADHQVAYGTSSTYLDPFQHFWSLSVQLQVFLVAPLVLVAVAFLVRACRAGACRGLLVPVAVLTAIAVAGGWWLTAADQSVAYFSTLARGWEFLAGALLALLVPRISLPSAVRVALGWLGLGALAVTGLLIDGAEQFPGPWALLPLLAGAAVVLAGSTPTRWGVDRLLGARPLANCGRYAYALYLWHWPVMSLWLVATGGDRLGLVDTLIVVPLVVLVAVSTHHLVEEPLRRPVREWRPDSRVLAGALALSLAFAGVVASGAYRQDARWIAEVIGLAEEADLSTHPGVMSTYEPDSYPVPEGMLAIPVPHAGVLDESDAAVGCDVVGTEPGLWCMYDVQVADGTAGVDVVLLGGSHSGAWVQPLRLVGMSLDWDVSVSIRAGCPFLLSDVLDVADYYDPDWTAGCNAWNEKLWDDLRADLPALVVTTYSRPFGPGGEPEWVPDEYVDVWRELDDLGIQVLAIRANAQLPTEEVICPGVDRCLLDRSEIYGDDDVIFGTELPGNVHVLDMVQYACSNGQCPSIIGNVRVYADQTHLTDSYGRTAWPILAAEVRSIYPELASPAP